MTTIGAPIAGIFPSASASVVKTTVAVSRSSKAPTATTTAAFLCSNPSLEDGDGLCTCSVGSSLVGTYTPSGGPGNSCPTAKPKR